MNRMFHSRIGFVLSTGTAALLALALSGCDSGDKTVNASPKAPDGPTTSLEHPAGVAVPDIPVAGRSEVDLVEEMILHRTMYARLLNVLATYYMENGYPEKAAWAASELSDLRRVKSYRYILDAEVPRAELTPSESIADADRLYDEGMKLLYKGGRGVPLIYNRETMRQAMAKFKELVEHYPTSDKIDDAAYYIGEIHKEYEQEADNRIAIEWYKRAIEWNPATPHPCRFRIATTYDYRLHERERALYWYQQTLENESKFTANDHIDFARNTAYAEARIRELTPEKHLRSPGESIADGRPAPSGTAEPAPDNAQP